MAERVRAALAALRSLEYTPFSLVLDLLRSENDYCALERAQLRAERFELIGQLLRAAPAPNVHAALNTLDELEYPPHELVRDILRSNDARCARARQHLSDNTMLLLNLLLPDARTPFERILAFLRTLDVAPTQFIIDLLDCSRPAIAEATSAAVPAILPLLTRCNEAAVGAWSLRYSRQLFTAEMLSITRKDAGFHANAANAQPEQLETFDLSALASKLRSLAPNLWLLFSHLVDARGSVRRARMPDPEAGPADETWIVGAATVPRHYELIAIADEADNDVDVPELEALADAGHPAAQGPADAMDVDTPIEARPPVAVQLPPVAARSRPSDAAIRNWRMLEIRIMTMISIAQLATNQNCNAVPMNLGFLTRMMHVSDSVINVLNHAGIVVSNKSIDRAVTSLSKAEEKRLLLQGATLTSQKAFDNFNFMERVAVPTAGRDNLYRSAISALNISSHPSLTPDHFRFSSLTWETNAAIKLPRLFGQRKPKLPTYGEMLGILDRLDPRSHDDDDSDAPSHLVESHAYYIRRALVQLEKGFSSYTKFLGDPAEVQRVPPHKTEWDPIRAMDLNQSTVADTIEAVERMLAQTGITDDITDEYVTFVHGDLGGSERLLSAQLFRSIEPSALARFKGIVDVPGLFHTVMASADAVFRLHVLPADARSDENSSSVFKYIKIILPKPAEHNKFRSATGGPSFRRAHDSFSHIMNGMLLECWLREAKVWNPSCVTLSAFAAQLKKLDTPEDAWRVIKKLSFDIANKYVAGADFNETRSKPDSDRDVIHENWQLYLAHTLLHTDLYHSIKIQDIGRVVYAIFHLLFVFAASKKNKYAFHMTRVLNNLAYVYPEPLREAFLTSWTINPSGKAGGGRGVDWLVELFNLYLKVVHSGASSNFGLEQIIKVSPLIKLYKVAFKNFVLSYHLVGRTSHHAPPDMTETLDRLRREIRLDKALDFEPGRSAKYKVPDAMTIGQAMFMAGKVCGVEGADEPDADTILIDFDDFELDDS